jgi:hypothetical protein
VIEGQWEILLFGTFTNGTKINTLPRFRYALKITGDVDVNGAPSTIIDGANASTKIGFWVEPCQDLVLEVRNIFFKNFKNAGLGYGFLMKSGGYVTLQNCKADNCDIGFAAIRNVNFKFFNATASNCGIGFRAQYGAMGAFGALDEDESGTSTLNDGCKTVNCPKGIDVTRGSNVHVDFCTLDTSTYAGVVVDMNSRAHVMGSLFKSCDHGVRCEGSGEWINNTTDVNTFTSCNVDYAHYGVSRETRMYSQTATNEFRTGVSTTKVTHSGTTANTVIYSGSSLGKIPARFFNYKQRVRLCISGTLSGAGNKVIQFRTTDINSSDAVVLMSWTDTSQKAFVAELTIYPIDVNKVRCILRANFHLETSRVYINDVTVDLSKDRLFRLYCQLDDGTTQSVDFTGFETFMMG